MSAPSAEAFTLQRPLPDGSLRIVACGEKKDGYETSDKAGPLQALGPEPTLI